MSKVRKDANDANDANAYCCNELSFFSARKGGPLPFYCQPDSLERACRKLPLWTTGTVFQVGHWTSGKCKYIAYFEATHVGFVELKPGSSGLVEMTDGVGSFDIGKERVYGITLGVPKDQKDWHPVPMDSWIPCQNKVFRITDAHNASLVVHMRVSEKVPFVVEHFVAGSNTIWTHDVTFYFTPSSKKYEQSRKFPCELSPLAKQFLQCIPDEDVDTIPDDEEVPVPVVSCPVIPPVPSPPEALDLNAILSYARMI